MLVLGIEGTAHTCGVGIVDFDPGRGDVRGKVRILANEVDMLRPGSGGIHPREAAEHHGKVLPGLIEAALTTAQLAPGDLDGIAFSQGPGLGPCLRTVATAARTLALYHGLPLAGVNHCVAHLEVARAVTPASDPVMLYASGANTQVIGESRGRYRVFGETLDIGIGNALDKFAREQSMPFPGGPRVEELAREGAQKMAGAELPVLPYTVKGMDVAFSGLVTAAGALVRKGVALPVVCHAVQEWAFSPLVEVTERALAHTGKDTVVLGGGVGRNKRLQQMLKEMAGERGAEAHWPEPALLSDNGAMIAHNGALLFAGGHETPISQSTVNQRYRTDDVPLLWRDGWRKDGATRAGPDDVQKRLENIDVFRQKGRAVGAEARLEAVDFLGRAAMVKRRVVKGYRHEVVERKVVSRRTRQEARMLMEAWGAGVRVPQLLDAVPEDGVLVMEEVGGPSLKSVFMRSGDEPEKLRLMREVAAMVARLHQAGIVHGDLTTSNLLTDREGPGAKPVLIDFGLSALSGEAEAQAVDLHVLEEALQATHAGHEELWRVFLAAYQENAAPDGGTLARLADLEGRGRYRSVVV